MYVCVAPKAGIASRPAKSTTLVEGARNSSMSAFDPTATIRSPSMAIASSKPEGDVGERTRPARRMSVERRQRGPLVWIPLTL